MSIVQEVTEGIANKPSRNIPAKIGTGGAKALTSGTPTLKSQAMGVVGEKSLISLVTNQHTGSADATITLYLWHDVKNMADGGFWSFGGANSTDYTKTFAQKGFGAFRAPRGMLFYLSASVEVGFARTDCPAVDLKDNFYVLNP